MKPAARNRHPATYITSPRSAGFAADHNFEFRIKQMLGHGGVRNFSGYSRTIRLELSDHVRRIEKRTADVNFARINLHMKSQRMPELIDAARTPGDAILDRVAHRANLTIKKIHVIAPNLEAILRRSPPVPNRRTKSPSPSP